MRIARLLGPPLLGVVVCLMTAWLLRDHAQRLCGGGFARPVDAPPTSRPLDACASTPLHWALPVTIGVAMTLAGWLALALLNVGPSRPE